MRKQATLRGGAAALLGLLLLLGCSPEVAKLGPPVRQPELTDTHFLTADGMSLAVQSWVPADGSPAAVIVAAHGFGDYANAFAMPGAWLAARRIAVYAYDQRGFGRSPNPGVWASSEALVSDLDTMVRLVEARYPQVPVYVLGESMGGAVVMVALTRPDAPPVAGAILAAPAVWGRATMGPIQSGTLWFAAHAAPGLELNGRNLGLMPSDNVPMLRALSKDPLILKEARADALWGITLLMDEALAAAPNLNLPLLVLYGKHDFIIPKVPTRMMIADLPKDTTGARHIAIYPKGYHMLLRDLDAKTVWTDIAAWIADPKAPLPSGNDKAGIAAIE